MDEILVKVKETTPLSADGSIDVDQWLQQLSSKGYFQDLALLRNTCELSQTSGQEKTTETGISCLQQGLAMADVLTDLEVDQETLAAAIIFENVRYAGLTIDEVEEQLGSGIAHLVKGVEKMSAIHAVQITARASQDKHHLDNIRKMLLAMVDDVRVVLIKLAERLCVLRYAAPLPAEVSLRIATEVMDIYAPLANRLGIGAIKWEMEDLAFRYLAPDDYKAIAKGLKARRLERDKFVNHIVQELNQQIQSMGIQHFAVYGRSKHIHSIYKKMQRKNVSLEAIYDATAVRVLVEKPEQCYEVLGMVHALWEQVPAEYDDYIVNPKANGYQSLHTAVKSDDRVFEVQIRTYDMHQLAEMGVAAHWKYKEGTHSKKASHERKIEWLREVLAWHQEMTANKGESDNANKEFLDDRVYVFTPDGDVVEVSKGATPLDFAYHVHSEIGHRCRGAKVNGHIVPLTYTLTTGDRVEVLTGKEPKPSRDWINPHLNYVVTPRARAKIIHWFRMQDHDKNAEEGHDILDKELKALGIKQERLEDILEDFQYKKVEDLYAGLGRGDIKLVQIISKLAPAETSKPLALMKQPQAKTGTTSDINIEGVGKLLTYMARCCRPVPGDLVIGYITQGRGVSIHRKDCPNIIHASDKQKLRFLQVSWGNAAKDNYIVDVVIKAYDRTGLLKDITSLLANEKAHVYSLQSSTDKKENIAYFTLTMAIDGLTALSRLLNKLAQVPNVLEARRQI